MNTNFKIIEQNRKKENPFTTPENYFDELPQIILNQCKTTSFKSEANYRFNKSILAYAASILIILGFSLAVLYLSNKNEKIKNNNTTDTYTENLLNIADLHQIDEKCLIDFIIEKSTEQKINQNDNDVLEYITDNTNNDNEIIELIDY